MKRTLVLPWIPLMSLLAACDPRPARFADAPPVEAVLDDAPIPMPRAFEPLPEWRFSEAYLRRPLVNALEPARVPEGGDVNALDEAPRSTWITPAGEPAPADVVDPPALPLHPLAAKATIRAGALCVVDARGRFFELWRDPPDRPEMETGAAAVTSRLLRALGYQVPGVWALEVGVDDFSAREPADLAPIRALLASGPKPAEDRFRVGVVRWPIGVDLGPTHAFDRRVGDRNDRVPHLDRRTLRALGAAFAWLGVGKLGPGVLRDAYAGAPGAGHVEHWIVDLGGALGADAVVRAQRPRDDDADLAGRNAWVTLGTFGLYTPDVTPTQRRWPALGEYGPHLPDRPFQTSPPFEPIDRMLPGDAYWIAKRMVALRSELIDAALAAARYSDAEVRARVAAALRARRLAVVDRAFAAVTPCEVERVEPGAVVLRDEAAQRGFAAAATTRYRIELVDDRGVTVAGPADVAPKAPRFRIALPANAPRYVVLRITALRDGRAVPRAMEAHFMRRASLWRLVGVRH